MLLIDNQMIDQIIIRCSQIITSLGTEMGDDLNDGIVFFFSALPISSLLRLQITQHFALFFRSFASPAYLRSPSLVTWARH